MRSRLHSKPRAASWIAALTTPARTTWRRPLRSSARRQIRPVPCTSVASAGPALEVKAAMSAAGYAQTPFVSSDGLFDGTGADKGSFIQQAGPLAANTYITQAGIAPVDADFLTRYRRRFGTAPSDYAAASYACTQVIIAAMREALAHGADAAGLREAVRECRGRRPSGRTQTVIGNVGFDANGDSLDQYVTFYSVDPSAEGGKGDWVILDQQNFGPAP